jgi:hypothetical protein
MSVMTDGGSKGSDPDDGVFDGDDAVETVEENADIVRDYLDDVVGSAKLDSFVGGFAAGLFIVLPSGQREIAAMFAALAGVELADTHKRRMVPVELIGEGKYGVVGAAVGLLVGFGATSMGYL